jgi:hypothetical protein
VLLCHLRGASEILASDMLGRVRIEKPLLARGEGLWAGQATKVHAGLVEGRNLIGRKVRVVAKTGIRSRDASARVTSRMTRGCLAERPR